MGLKSNIIPVRASGLVTVAGQSDPIDVSGYEAGSVMVNITAKTGTFTNHQFFLQVSPDGTNWYGAATGTGLLVGLVVGAAADITTGLYWKNVDAFVGPWLRLAWTLAGGTNVTFSSTAAFRY
jgi:hypothetical protein